jgi:MoaA/NifB/PqqE/SkfB family radical SAM enzyme
VGTFFALPTKLRLARSLVTKAFPIYVQYYVTARCNLACEQCNVIYANADVREATTDEACRIAENLARIGVSVVLLTGGEPFARRDLPELVRAFASNGIHTRLQTNGLATRGALEACIAAGANDISISLDSLDPGVQDRINGGVSDSWRKAIRTVAVVNEIFPDDALAAFGCVLAPRNLEQVPDVLRFATEIGWWLSLVPAHATTQRRPLSFRTYDPALVFSKARWERVDAILDEIRAMKSNGFHVYDSGPYLDDMKRMVRGEPLRWRDRNQGVCDSPNLYFAVLPNGDMAVCCDWRMKSRISVIAHDFPERFRAAPTHEEARTIAAACTGCLFGSFPEITISARWLRPMLERTLSFSRRDQRRTLRRTSEAELCELAAAIRARSPQLYGTTPS